MYVCEEKFHMHKIESLNPQFLNPEQPQERFFVLVLRMKPYMGMYLHYSLPHPFLFHPVDLLS